MEWMDSLKAMRGGGSQAAKGRTIRLMLDSCSQPIELEYLTKILIRHLSLGMTDKTMKPILEAHFEQANEPSVYTPMLARPLRSFEECLQFSTNKGCAIAAEVKYDGERTNVYYRRGQPLRLMSRSSREQFETYPDLYPLVAAQLDSTPGLQDAVLDAEIVAVERSTGRVLPVQVLINRKGRSRESLDGDYQ